MAVTNGLAHKDMRAPKCCDRIPCETAMRKLTDETMHKALLHLDA